LASRVQWKIHSGKEGGKTEVKCISGSYRGDAGDTFSNQWIPKDQFGRHRLFSNAFHRRSPNRPHMIPTPVSLSAAFPSAALNHYHLIFDVYRPSRRALQFSGKCQCAVFCQLLLPRFSNSDPCDGSAALRLPRHLLKSRSNVSKPRHQTIAIMASLSAQLVDRGRNHRLRTSLAGFGSPPPFSSTLSPTVPGHQSPAQNRSLSKRLVRHTCWRARAMRIRGEAFSPLVV